MNQLTKEEVLHVANLARIEVTDEELNQYAVQLKELMNEIDKIKNVEVHDSDMLVTPVTYPSTMRKDEQGLTTSFEEMKKNLPDSLGNFVEVELMINE